MCTHDGDVVPQILVTVVGGRRLEGPSPDAAKASAAEAAVHHILISQRSGGSRQCAPDRSYQRPPCHVRPPVRCRTIRISGLSRQHRRNPPPSQRLAQIVPLRPNTGSDSKQSTHETAINRPRFRVLCAARGTGEFIVGRRPRRRPLDRGGIAAAAPHNEISPQPGG